MVMSITLSGPGGLPRAPAAAVPLALAEGAGLAREDDVPTDDAVAAAAELLA